jgi:hypothetical protein
LKNDVNVPSKSNKLKNFLKKLVFGVLKVIDENILIHYSEAWIPGSGSTPKCHGSATLLAKNIVFLV